jgi:hypothetical protein
MINVLTPILIIIIGAGGWWLIRYWGAPRGFEIALYVVVAIALILWLIGVFPALYVDAPRIEG